MTTTTTTTSTTLPGGERLSVLPIGPATTDAVRAFVSSLSPEARYRRFFQAVPVPDDRLLARLCDVDQVDHLAWLLVDAEQPVAEVRGVRLRADRNAMEVAVAVHEGWRRRGVAAHALRALGAVAEGVETFTAWIQPDNRACDTLMRSLGLDVRWDDGLLEARGPVPAWTGPATEAQSLRRLQRAAARPTARVAA